jgi:hypothetical protein
VFCGRRRKKPPAEFCFRYHDHDVPAVVYSLYRVVLNKICEQNLCFLEEGEKTAHLECFVFAFMISQQL